jgi:alpha-galactosidase
VQNPNIPNVPGVTNANTNVAGIYNDAFQNQLAAANYGNQGINNMFSLAGDLGSAAILKSDRRLKRDIKPMGTINGFNAYLFRYLDSDQQYLGVMADEVLKIKPEAVIVGDDGYMSVNYGMLS